MFKLLMDVCTSEIQGEIVCGDTDSIMCSYNGQNTKNVTLHNAEGHINAVIADHMKSEIFKVTYEKFTLRFLPSVNSKKSYINITIDLNKLPIEDRSVQYFDRVYTKLDIQEMIVDPSDYLYNKFGKLWPHAKICCKSFSWSLMGDRLKDWFQVFCIAILTSEQDGEHVWNIFATHI
jgi:hypothetical protein